MRSQIAAAVLTIVTLAPVARAAAGARADTCIEAYEGAQEDRQRGQLVSARRHLFACVADGCPDFVVRDCRRWLEDVEAALPSVVFAVRAQGAGARDLEAVSVTANGRPLLDRLDGRAVPLDPGKYRFEIAAAGFAPRTVEAMVVEGKKYRQIEVELAPLTTPITPAPAPAPALGPPRLRLSVAFAAFAAAGAVGFTAFGIAGRRQEDRLRRDCAPACAPGVVDDVRRKYLIADVSLGAGVAALGAATYFFFRERGEPARGREQARVSLDLTGAAPMVGYADVF